MVYPYIPLHRPDVPSDAEIHKKSPPSCAGVAVVDAEPCRCALLRQRGWGVDQEVGEAACEAAGVGPGNNWKKPGEN